jgi:hypothetical protein
VEAKAGARVWNTARGATLLIRELRGLFAFMHPVDTVSIADIPTPTIISVGALMLTFTAISKSVRGKRVLVPANVSLSVARVEKEVKAKTANVAKVARVAKASSPIAARRKVKTPTQLSHLSA